MPTVTIESDGETNEVDVPTDAVEYTEDELEDVENDDLPSGLVTEDSVQAALNNRLPRAYRKTLESAGLDPDDYKDEEGNFDLDALEETDLFETLAEERGIELREDGRPKGSLKDEEIQDLQEKAKKYDSAKDELEELRQERRQSRLNDAWEQFKEHAPPIRDGAEKVLRKDFEDRVELDDGDVVVTDDNGEIRTDEVHAPVGVDALADELPGEMGFAFEEADLDSPDTEPGGDVQGETLTRKQFRQEVKKARQEGDMERMNELEEMEANDQITD